MSFARGPKISTDNLFVSLDAANHKSYTSGSSTWNDLSGNGYNASLSNIDFSNSDKALNFNGSTSTAFISGITPPRSTHTILIWFKSDVALANTTSTSSRVTLFKNDGSWNPGLWINGRIIRPHQPPEYRDKNISYRSFTEWNMLGQIWDGLDLYTVDNGIVTLDTIVSSNYSQSDVNGMSIGYETSTGAYTLDGKISIFQIYNSALTNEEVLQYYNATKSRFGL